MPVGETYSSPGIVVKRFKTPVISVTLDQIYTAIRMLDEEADVHIPIDETLSAGYSGWVELPLPAGRLCCQRYGLEWGDREINLKWSIDDRDKVACQLHTVMPVPTFFEFARYWLKRDKLYLYRENTDDAAAHTYHLSVVAVMATNKACGAGGDKISAFARGVLE